RWREIGADGRICDLIDSQLAAIEGACAQISTIDPRDELKAAFDLLRDRVEQTDTGDVAAPAARPSPAPTPEMSATADAPSADAEMAMMASEAPEAQMPQEVAEAAEEMAVSEAMDVTGEIEITEVAEGHIAIEESGAELASSAETVEEL